MDERYRTLCYRLADLAGLDEGRRDMSGILLRAAASAREVLEARLSYAAASGVGGPLVAVDEGDGREIRVETWEGPGAFGTRVLQHRGALECHGAHASTVTAQDLLGRPSAAHVLGAPVNLPDRPPGLLMVARDTEPFSDLDAALLEILAQHTSTALGNLRAFQEVESLAVTDDLTRVYNYRFLKAALRREVERATRYGHVFSVIMIDVDHLKLYNEGHGHLQGSECLRRVAALLSGSSRAIDLVAKYGGDEFLIILPQTRADGAGIMGARVCESVANATFPHCRRGDMTVSIGVGCFPEHGTTMETLLAAADEALFEAKRAGRNCVRTAQGPGKPGQVVEAA